MKNEFPVKLAKTKSGPNFIQPLQHENLLSMKTLPRVNRIYKPHCDVVPTVLDSYLTILWLARIKKRSLGWQGDPLNHHLLCLSEFWCLSSSMTLFPGVLSPSVLVSSIGISIQVSFCLGYRLWRILKMPEGTR